MLYSFVAGGCIIAIIGLTLFLIEVRNAKEVDPSQSFLHDDIVD